MGLKNLSVAHDVTLKYSNQGDFSIEFILYYDKCDYLKILI